MFATQPPGLVVDEFLHASQINILKDGDNTHLPYITTFTVIHHVYVAFIELFGLQEPIDYRWFNFLIAGLLILTLTRVCKNNNGTFDSILACQLLYLPIALPYYPLIYTDIIALVLIYAAFYQLQQSFHWRSAFLLSAAVVVRQPSLIWLGMFSTLVFFDHLNFKTFKLNRSDTFEALLKVAPYALSIVAFLIVFYLNKGVALGDKDNHKISINITNVYFMILVFFLVFFPLFISRFKEVIKLLKEHKWIVLVLMITMPLFIFTFSVTHQYNSVEGNIFLRNWIVNHIEQYPSLQVITYFISAYTILAMISIKFKQPKWNWLFLFLPVSVIFMPLIEQRYYIVGMAFWQLFRVRTAQLIEMTQLIWMAVFSLTLYLGVSKAWFYL